MYRGNDSDGDVNPLQSNNEEEFNDEYLSDHNYDNEADKNRIVEQSPRGRFIRFNEELGSGAYKTVYKGYDNETGCEIAWNIIKLQRLPSKERKRISDEISLLKQLKHPNIIHFISAWINKQKEEVVFITEIVTGGSLKRYLKKIRSPRLKVIKAWCKEILQGIEYLHNLKPNPIIHRDIKCDNIFINSNKGEIRIGDLGLATCMSNAFADSVLGTPEFMAPEMYEEVYGPSVDVYSFGMCVLEMVTNQTPYRECQNPAQVYKKVIQGIKPEALNLIANDEVKSFIIECLKPKDERPTAAELLKNKFLLISDSEIDNQPVALESGNNLNTIDEESSLREASKLSEKVPKFYNQAVFEQGYVPEEQRGVYDMKSPKDRREERVLVDGSSEKFQKEPIQNINMQMNFKLDPLVVQKKLSDHSKISKMNLDNSKSPFSQNTHQKIFRDEDKIKEKSHKKDEVRYHFESKGIHENHLIIYIKLETTEIPNEHFIEIHKEKLSQEKIAKKIMKCLNLSNPNDPYFISELRNLIESLDSIPFNSSSLSSNYLNTATTINQKSVNMIDNNLLQNQLSHFSTSNTAFFQPDLFNQFYERYMMSIPREYLFTESEEAMNSRHQRELMELQSAHLTQKRSLWDKKQNILSYNSNSMLFPGGLQSNILDCDDPPKNNIPNEINFRVPTKNKFIYATDFTISPFSSGTISPNNGNFYSVNNSVENMASLLKKLGNVEKNNTTIDEQSKSAIANPEQLFENRNTIISPKNDNYNKTPIEKKTFKFPTSTNTSSQNIVNLGSINMAQNPKEKINSPRGISEKFEIKHDIAITRQGSDQSYDKPHKETKLVLPIQNDGPAQMSKKIMNLNTNLLQILTTELNNNLSPSSRHPTQLAFNATSPPLEVQMQKDAFAKNEIQSPNLPFHSGQGKYASSQKTSQIREENISLGVKTGTINLTNEILNANTKPVRALIRQGSNEGYKKSEVKTQGQQPLTQQISINENNLPKNASDMIQIIKNHKMKGNLMIDAPDMDPEDILVLQSALGLLTGHPVVPDGLFNDKLVKLGQEMAGITPDGVVNPIAWEKIINAIEKKAYKDLK